MSATEAHFDAYVPRVASTWDEQAPGSSWRTIDGSLLFVDVSGFTNLSERLARKGRIGAEELTGVLNRVFGEMLDLVFNRGGSLLKFGGDALLLLFDTPDHVIQAVASAVEMRAALRRASNERTSVGRVNLKMSSGVHCGPVDFFLIGDSHRELIVTGPTASTTVTMEATADANEIVVSQAAKDHLPSDFASNPKGEGWILRKQKVNHPTCGPILRDVSSDVAMPEYVSTGLRDYLAAGIAEPEHRIATIGFVKFKGIDHLLESSGHEAVQKTLDDLVSTVQKAADTEGVTFLGSDIDADGGKLILSAGVPTSQHDDEGRILRAARRILDEELDLSVHIGLNRGHVFSGDVGNVYRRTYTVMGDTVNLAARLMAAAPPGMLYASPGVLDLSSTLFRTEALEPFHVKGKDQPVQAYAVYDDAGIRPPDLKYELPFHGREAELELLVQIITTCARTGRGGMMTITGDTGLGKTRLIAEVLEECPDLDTLMVQAEPNGADNPYWAFRDPLRRMLSIDRAEQAAMATDLENAIDELTPDLRWAVPLLGDVMHIDVPDTEETAAIDPKFRPERTADALIELLAAMHSGPFAAIGEDGHWMDNASIDLLRRIGEAAKEHPWTVILTARGERSDFEPLGDEIVLRPLDEDAVRTIVIEATAAAPLRPHELDAIVNRAGGNPMFLSAILGMVRETGSAEDLPDSLGAVVSTEIDTLPPLTRQLLRYASVLGRSFRRVVLDEFLSPEEVQLDKATQEDLVRFIEVDDRDRMRFRHAVVHDVAYEGLSYRRRRELHARAGDVVERLAGDDPDAVAEFLAFHYAQSGNYAKVWRYARIAGDKAMNAYANTEAETHYRRAIEAARHLDETNPEDLVGTWKNLGIVREFTGQFEKARDAYLQALRLNGDNPEREVDLRIRRADVWLNLRRVSQAKRELTLAQRTIPERDDSLADELRARLRSFESRVQTIGGNQQGALAAASDAIQLARHSAEQEALARAYLVFDLSNSLLNDAPPEYTEDAIEIYQRLGLLERSAKAMSNLGFFAYFRGDWDDAVKWYEKSVMESDRAGDVISAAAMRANIAEVLISQRRYEKGSLLLEEASRVLRASEAHQYMQFVELQRARLDIALGNPDRGAHRLNDLFHDQIAGSRTAWTPEIAIALAQAHVLEHKPDQALNTIDALETEISDFGGEIRAAINRIRGLAKAEAGEFEEAERLFEQGRSIAEQSNAMYEELLIREAKIATRRRGGGTPAPVDLERVGQLCQLLHVDPLIRNAD